MLFQWVKKLDEYMHFDSVAGLDQRHTASSKTNSWLDIRQRAKTAIILNSGDNDTEARV